MLYEMNLQKAPFDLIKNGQKTIEMRLCKNNRDKIQRGDHIVFHNEKDGEKLEVLVLNMHKYPSFKELYENHKKESLGYRSDEIANPDDMLIYYSKEDIEKYGVLAIEIKVQ